jgi:transcriptional regulator with XRE-family HTH domain
MEGDPPPVCARIRETRERLKEEAKAQGGATAAKEFSQEQVAHRVGVSLKAYRAFEDFREPSYDRRQAIAKALGFSEDYFEMSGQVEAAQARLEAKVDELGTLLAKLDARLAGQAPPRRSRKRG